MTLLTDAHCHLQDPAFTADLPNLLARAANFGIGRFVVNGTSPADWSAVADLAMKYPQQVLPQFGVHPWRVEKLPEDWEERLKAMLIRFPQAGIGEIGLDRQLTEAPLEQQVEVFQRQWALAARLRRGCSLHIMRAWQDLHPILREPSPSRFLLHSYSGSAGQVEGFVKAGATFSFGGAVIRHDNSEKLKSALRAVPSGRLLLETDAPFQHPAGKEKRQEPTGLLKIAEAVAEMRGEALSTLLRVCEENAAAFFK